jgi:two-component system, OmpR family, KDP operon response regulator KdpE
MLNTPEILVIGGGTPLHKLLVSGGYTVLQADGAAEADGWRQNAGYSPDLILLHLGSPPDDAHGLLRKLRDGYRKPVIVISGLSKEKDVIEALDNGASDYLIKPFRSGELLARIRAALRSATLPVDDSEPMIRSKGLEIDLLSRTVKKDNEWLKLTATQYSLLVLFGKNPGKVLTHQYLLREIWGSDYTGELQYLRVFVGQLRKKIEKDANSPEYIITESGIGYRFLGEGDKPTEQVLP